MPNRMSEYMSDRMPEIMSEYMPNRMSVGGDHSKKVISQITIKLENHVITFQITITNLMNTDAGLTLFEKIVLPCSP
jgi:hypothetical protein